MARVLTHTISFRVPASEVGKLQVLRSTFADQQWGVAMRWLFDQPEVLDVIDRRANGGVVESGAGYARGGIDASLPRGDR